MIEDQRTGPVSPAVQLRELLAAARAEGLTFDAAWERSVGRVVRRDDGTRDLVGGRIRWPHDTAHRKEWKAIFIQKKQKMVWQSAYYREPATRSDERLAALIAA